MRDRPEISDWQMVILVLLIILAAPAIIMALGVKFLIQWLRFRWSER